VWPMPGREPRGPALLWRVRLPARHHVPVVSLCQRGPRTVLWRLRQNVGPTGTCRRAEVSVPRDLHPEASVTAHPVLEDGAGAGVSGRSGVWWHAGLGGVRSLGSDRRVGCSAIGQTTHLAARMEQLATPGTIRLTADTLRLVEGFVDVTPLGPVPVKGIQEPIDVFEVTGAGAARTRLQAAVLRGLSPFRGRDRELEQLGLAQQHAGEGRGQLVALVGEAG